MFFASGTGGDNHATTLESIYNNNPGGFLLGHYLSSLPDGINLDDISSGRLYSYGNLPPDDTDADIVLAKYVFAQVNGS